MEAQLDPATMGKKLIARGRTAEVYAWQDNQVLKLFYDGCPARWVQHELEISGYLQNTALPVPRMFGEVTLGGRRGILYERVEGVSMLRQVVGHFWQLPRQARLLAELQTHIHQQSGEGFDPMETSLKNCISRVDCLPEETKAEILRRMERLPGGSSLCHFDFHPDQVMLTARGPVILDWMTACRGNPLADVARTCIIFHFGEAPGTSRLFRLVINLVRSGFSRIYLRQYLKLNPQASQAQIRAWMLPVAAARLDEKIPNEQAGLLKLIRDALA